MKRGFGMLEILIAAALIALTVVGFGQVARTAIRSLEAEKMELEAAYLADEGIEAVRALRDSSWEDSIAALVPDTYYLELGEGWSLVSSPEPLLAGRYTRSVRLDEVRRDATTFQISSNPADPVDGGTRLVTVTVSWPERGVERQIERSAYITDFLGN